MVEPRMVLLTEHYGCAVYEDKYEHNLQIMFNEKEVARLDKNTPQHSMPDIGLEVIYDHVNNKPIVKRIMDSKYGYKHKYEKKSQATHHPIDKGIRVERQTNSFGEKVIFLILVFIGLITIFLSLIDNPLEKDGNNSHSRHTSFKKIGETKTCLLFESGRKAEIHITDKNRKLLGVLNQQHSEFTGPDGELFSFNGKVTKVYPAKKIGESKTGLLVKSRRTREVLITDKAGKVLGILNAQHPEFTAPSGEIFNLKGNRVSWSHKRVGPLKMLSRKTTDSTVSSESQLNTYRKSTSQKKMSYRKVSNSTVLLRSQPSTLSDEDIETMLKKHNFFSKKYNKWQNESGDFKNDFVNNGDGTIIDRTTGLMWQQAGSDNYLPYKKVQAYIKRLNHERFAGYGDWRLPTIEELASLIENKKMNGNLYIDPVFDRNQSYCWSADKRSSKAVWSASFFSGIIYWLVPGNSSYIQAVRTLKSQQED